MTNAAHDVRMANTGPEQQQRERNPPKQQGQQQTDPKNKKPEGHFERKTIPFEEMKADEETIKKYLEQESKPIKKLENELNKVTFKKANIIYEFCDLENNNKNPINIFSGEKNTTQKVVAEFLRWEKDKSEDDLKLFDSQADQNIETPCVKMNTYKPRHEEEHKEEWNNPLQQILEARTPRRQNLPKIEVEGDWVKHLNAGITEQPSDNTILRILDDWSMTLRILHGKDAKNIPIIRWSDVHSAAWLQPGNATGPKAIKISLHADSPLTQKRTSKSF